MGPSHTTVRMLSGVTSIRDAPRWGSIGPVPTMVDVESELAAGSPGTAAEWVRTLGNRVNLSTPFGLLVARIGRARIRRGPRGLVLAEGYRLPFPVAGAFTVGDVLLTPSTFAELLRRYPLLLRHEERHSWQYLYCCGLPFLIAYPVAMGWSMVRTGDRAAANVFEVHAGLTSGGYHRYPTRPISVGVRDMARRLDRALRKPRRREG